MSSSSLPMVLRPAWRNFWHLMAMAVITFIAGVVLLGMWLFGDAVSEPVGKIGFGLLMLISFGFVTFILEERFSKKFVIEKNRLLAQFGIFSRKQQSITMKSIRSVELEQSVIQRMFGVGNLAFYTAGTADAEVRFKGIVDPGRIKAGVRRLSEMASEGQNGNDDNDGE